MFADAYLKASADLREGGAAHFPLSCFPPGLPYVSEVGLPDGWGRVVLDVSSIGTGSFEAGAELRLESWPNDRSGVGDARASL